MKNICYWNTSSVEDSLVSYITNNEIKKCGALGDPLKLNDFNQETIENECTDQTERTQIQEFYKDANIFVTGGTGFLGRILLEKLLRSCKDLSTVYVLIRNKKGKTVSTRVEEMFDDIVFERMKKECPKFRHKIIGIAGDCSLPDLGISAQDRKTLSNEVTMVFHVAATVRFDEKLKTAVAINLRATQEMLSLAQEMRKLKSFIHVSTAYSNCIEKVIEEKVYPPAMDHKKLIVLADALPDKMLDNLTPMILDKYPNTYAFTKQIAEDTVRQAGQELPVGITRPSVVVATYREPIRSWINNMYGATGVVAGSGVGLLRTLHCDRKCNANIVPVDMCVNSMIASAWDVNQLFLESKAQNKHYEVPVYNYESSNDCPIDWDRFMDTTMKYGLDTPSVRAIWYFCLILEKNYYLYLLYTFFLHTIPSLIVDGALICVGKKPKMIKIYSKIHKFATVLSYFSTKSWIFKSNNVQRVCKKMSKRDNDIFFSDLKQLHWDEYFRFFVRGIRVYLVNDPIETLPEATIKWRRLYWAHQVTKAVFAYLVLRLLWSVLLHAINLIL